MTVAGINTTNLGHFLSHLHLFFIWRQQRPSMNCLLLWKEHFLVAFPSNQVRNSSTQYCLHMCVCLEGFCTGFLCMEIERGKYNLGKYSFSHRSKIYLGIHFHRNTPTRLWIELVERRRSLDSGDNQLAEWLTQPPVRFQLFRLTYLHLFFWNYWHQYQPRKPTICGGIIAILG